MMTTHPFNSQKLILPFLGERTYSHGTTLFEVFAKQFTEAEDITLKINNMILTNHVLLFDAAEKSSAAPSYATFVCRQNNILYKIGVAPLEQVLPIEKVIYDEAAIVANTHFSANTALLNKVLDFSLIKTLVAINKELVSRAITNKTNTQILFARIDLHFIPKTYNTLAVHLQLEKQTGKFFISQIIIDGAHVGELYFSWTDKHND